MFAKEKVRRGLVDETFPTHIPVEGQASIF